MMTRKRLRSRQGGFTLLELTIVLAILAAVAGTVAAAYDGLSDKAAVGTSTFNDAALDSAMRTYKVLNHQYPDNMDSLLVDDATATPTLSNFYAGLNAELTTSGTDQGRPKLIAFTPTANQLAALNNVGILHAQYVVHTLNQIGAIPNSDFLSFDPSQPIPTGTGLATFTGSRGVNQTLSTTTALCKVDTLYLRNVAAFSGGTVAGSGAPTGDVVVAFGIGPSATIVKNGIAQAPYYAKAAPNEYGRFLAMFLVTRDVAGTNGAAAPTVPPQNIPSPSSPGYATFYADLPNAQFLGILDGKGDGQDEEYSEYTGQKGN